MGGDEFLIFTKNVDREDIQESIDTLLAITAQKGYHISVGMNYSIKNIDTDSLVREAEK